MPRKMIGNVLYDNSIDPIKKGIDAMKIYDVEKCNEK